MQSFEVLQLAASLISNSNRQRFKLRGMLDMPIAQ